MTPGNRVLLTKSASPRWAKMWNSLNTTSRTKLVQGLDGGTRRIGRSPMATAGAEGVAWNSVTPGKGLSVIKNYFSEPLGLGIKEREVIHNTFPDLFARIYRADPAKRMTIMERIATMDAPQAQSDFARNLTRRAPSGMIEWPKGVPRPNGVPRYIDTTDLHRGNVGYKTIDQVADPSFHNPAMARSFDPWLSPAPDQSSRGLAGIWHKFFPPRLENFTDRSFREVRRTTVPGQEWLQRYRGVTGETVSHPGRSQLTHARPTMGSETRGIFTNWANPVSGYR